MNASQRPEAPAQKPAGDHRSRVTKMLIRKAFTELLRQKPIQSITIKELCQQAGIHRGTFYAHYQDIYDLLQQIEDELLADLLAALAPVYQATDKKHFLADVCAGIFQCLRDNSDLCIVMLGDHSDKNYVGKLLAYGKDACLTAYSKHFTYASQKQLEYFYAFVSNGCMGLMRQWIQEGMVTSVPEIAQMAEKIMLHGIGFFEPGQV